MSSINIRRVKTSLDNLCLEKQKMEKGDKPKKKTAAKVKAKLRIEEDVSWEALKSLLWKVQIPSLYFQNDYSSRAGAFEADDYDDFM